MEVQIDTFDSVAEFADFAEKNGTKCGRTDPVNDPSTERNGGITFKEALKRARFGDASYTDKMLPEDMQFDMGASYMFETVRSPYGGRTVMSDYLTNSPTPMRRRVKRLRDIAPLKVVVSLNYQTKVSAEASRNVGADGRLLAIRTAAQARRPVSVYRP